VEIHYTLDSSSPTRKSLKYREPIIIDTTCELKARAFKTGDSTKTILQKKYFESILDTTNLSEIILNNPISPEYYDSGIISLVDQQSGSIYNPNKKWLGFRNGGLDVVLDFGEEIDINYVTLSFLVDYSLKCFPPSNITLLSSENSLRYNKLYSQDISISSEQNTPARFVHQADLSSVKTRYLRIIADKLNECPKWHSEEAKPTWLLIDEIILE